MKENVPLNEEISLIDILKILWAKKLIIIIGTAAITVLAVVYALFLPDTYTSTGTLRISDDIFMPASGIDTNSIQANQVYMHIVTQEEYNTCVDIIADNNNFNNYIKNIQIKSEARIKEIKRLLTKTHFERVFKPTVYSLGKDGEGYVSDIQIEAISAEANGAVENINILGNYIRETIMMHKLSDYIISSHRKNILLQKNTEYSIATNTLLISSYQRKQDTILKHLSKHARELNKNSTQVTDTVQTAKYLGYAGASFVNETELARLESRVDILKAEFEKYRLLAAFYDEARKLVNKKEPFGAVFQKINGLKTLYFKNPKEHTGKALAHLLIENDLSSLEYLYGTVMQFIAGPSEAVKKAHLMKKKIVQLAFFISLFLSVCLAFLVDMWEKNKNKTVAAVQQ
ncbi:Wzz/FepE/Etk N-terminal domain-containing protein [Spirochaetota bacterium]